MNISLLKHILFFLFLMTAQYVHSQTFIEPILGASFAKNEAYAGNHSIFHGGYVISDPKFERANISVGIAISQHITKRFHLRTIFQYGENHMGYSDRGVVGLTDFKFERYTFSTIPSFQIFNHFTIGTGINCHRLSNMQGGKRNLDLWSELLENHAEFQLGGILSIGYNFRSILLFLNYTNLHSISKRAGSFIKKSTVLELTLGYRFMIYEK